MTTAWAAIASEMQSEDSTAVLGDWGNKHNPVISSVAGIATMPYRAVGGMVLPFFSAPVYGLLKAAQQFPEIFGGKDEAIEFGLMKAKQSVKSAPAIKKIDQAIEMYKELDRGGNIPWSQQQP
jgi:hypothetical protein